jgi:hypothetical protein
MTQHMAAWAKLGPAVHQPCWLDTPLPSPPITCRSSPIAIPPSASGDRKMEIRRQLLSTLAVFQRRRRLVSISWVAEELQRPIKKTSEGLLNHQSGILHFPVSDWSSFKFWLFSTLISSFADFFAAGGPYGISASSRFFPFFI